MWQSFRAIFQKEFLHLRRDKATFALAFGIPLFQLILFGFIDQTVHNVATVVVDQDRSTDSRELLDRLRATGTFKVVDVTANPHDARSLIVSGRARIGIVIPPDYHDKRTRRQDAKILVLIDGSDSTVSAQALASVNGLVASMNIEEIRKGIRAPDPVAAQPIILFNPDGRTANYIIPGLVAVLVQIVAIVLAAVSIVREREKGTLEQLLVTPINPLGLMLGKLGPYLVVGLGEMALILFCMRFGFGVPIRGNLVFLFGMALIYLFALLALDSLSRPAPRPRPRRSKRRRCSCCRRSSCRDTSSRSRAYRCRCKPSARSCRRRTWSRSCAASCFATRDRWS
jgi:ABC-2 type transport system permease protein